MKKELKSAWINALRNRGREQGRMNLLKDGKYCCVGILCEVVGYGKQDVLNIDGSVKFVACVNNQVYGMAALLPPSVRQNLSLPEKVLNTCYEMNDSKKMSFAEIADWLETNLEVTE